MKNHGLIMNKLIRGFLILGTLFILSCKPVVPLAPTCIGWEFNTDGDGDGWQLGQGIAVAVQGGYMLGSITQPQGFWGGPDNLNIDAAAYKSLEMRYRIDSVEASDTAYLYWIKAGDSQFGNDKRIKFEVQTNNTWQDISVDLAQSINWTGVVTDVRLYPAWFSNLGASVEYDYIRLCN